MSLREENLSVSVEGETRNFQTSNRRRTSQGVVFMSDAEFAAHKAEQQAAMEKQILDEKAMVAREQEIAQLNAKLEADTLTLKEVRKLLRLERGLK